jgi:chromosome partitioning protein
MEVFAFCSFKGGTAKTSSALHLGACLAKYHKKKVLLIDFDSQANLSTGIGIGFDCLDAMTLVLKGEKPLSEIIQKTCVKKLDLAPANVYLDGIEAESPLALDLYSHERLRKALRTIEGNYDFVFIDTPPSLGWLTQSALFAARYSIICATPEPYSILGLRRLKDYHDKVCENHELSCAGVLFSFWDKLGSANGAYLEAVEEAFPGKVFETKIRRDIAISRAILQGKPTHLIDDEGRAAQDFKDLSKEFLKRMTQNKFGRIIEKTVGRILDRKTSKLKK